MNPNEVTAKFSELSGRRPEDGDLFEVEGHLLLHSSPRPSPLKPSIWVDLGPLVEEVPDPIECDLGNECIVSGSPAHVLTMALRVWYRIPEGDARKFAPFAMDVLSKAGWIGPHDTRVDPVPGVVLVTHSDRTDQFLADDVRHLPSQIQSPEFNGFLVFEDMRTTKVQTTRALNISEARMVEIEASLPDDVDRS